MAMAGGIVSFHQLVLSGRGRYIGPSNLVQYLVNGYVMATISPASSAQTVTQMAWQQLRLQQARQNAERAEQAARALQVQAQNAEQVADLAEENARSVSAQSDQANAVAGRAQQGLAIIKTVEQMQGQLISKVVQVSERLGFAHPAEGRASRTVESVAVAPVMNTSGQLTGTVISTTA